MDGINPRLLKSAGNFLNFIQRISPIRFFTIHPYNQRVFLTGNRLNLMDHFKDEPHPSLEVFSILVQPFIGPGGEELSA